MSIRTELQIGSNDVRREDLAHITGNRGGCIEVGAREMPAADPAQPIGYIQGWTTWRKGTGFGDHDPDQRG